MPKHSVEIPKGTVIKIHDEIKVLTKGIKLAQKGNDLVVVDLTEITMKNDERIGDAMNNGLPEVKNTIPMPKVKSIKNKGLELKYLKLALDVSNAENVNAKTKHEANELLRAAFKKIQKILIEDDKTNSSNI